MNVEWHVGRPGFVFIYGPQGEEIAQVSPFQFSTVEARSIAAQIVREHNAHDGLVTALRKAENFAWMHGSQIVDGVRTICEDERGDAWRTITAALAKAGAA